MQKVFCFSWLDFLKMFIFLFKKETATRRNTSAITRRVYAKCTELDFRTNGECGKNIDRRLKADDCIISYCRIKSVVRHEYKQ